MGGMAGTSVSGSLVCYEAYAGRGAVMQREALAEDRVFAGEKIQKDIPRSPLTHAYNHLKSFHGVYQTFSFIKKGMNHYKIAF